MKRLIAEAHVKPTKIIFFDDKRYNLESVETELATIGVSLIGFRYGFLDAEVAAFRPDIANTEWVHFKATGKPMSDNEARELIFAR